MATFTYTRTKKSNPDPGKTVDSFLRKNWFECLIILALLYLGMCRNVSFTIGYSAPQAGVPDTESPFQNEQLSSLGILSSLTETSSEPDRNPVEVLQQPELPASLDAIDQDRLIACQQFIQRFAKVAIAEQEKYNIPASVILAQALLASRAGETVVAKQANNYFGTSCDDGSAECVQANGEPYKIFSSPWESFRNNSLLLQSTTFTDLYDLPSADYRGWANGLVEMGYSNDPGYDDKLVQIIESLDLHLFDKQ